MADAWEEVREGYFTAGDMGYIDAAGYLFLTGRSAEIIISGGVNIYPQEIDDVLAQHPARQLLAGAGSRHLRCTFPAGEALV